MGRYSTGQRVIIFLLVLAFVRGLVYSAVIPPWQGPDEVGHFEYARLLYEKRHLPTPKDISPSLQQQIVASLYEHRFWRYIHRPVPKPLPSLLVDEPFLRRNSFLGERHSLTYLLHAAALALVSSQDLVVQLYFLRIVSVVMGLIVGWLAYLIAKEACPKDAFMQFGVPAFVVLLPMHTYILSSVNDEALAEIFASLLIYILIKTSRKGLSFGRAIGICLTIALALWSKTTTVFLIPLVLFAVLVRLASIARRRSLAAWKRELSLLGIVCMGTILAARFSPSYATIRKFASYSSNLLSAHNSSSQALDGYGTALISAFRSFWGVFGWMALSLDQLWYRLAALLVITSLVGLAILGARTVRSDKREERPESGVIVMILMASLLAVASLVAYVVVMPSGRGFGQGRYLFPAIIPFAMVLLLGLKELAQPRATTVVLRILFMGMVLFDSLCLAYYILPFFYT